jgi:diguanylate cyclase (GGDEF)-like protein
MADRHEELGEYTDLANRLEAVLREQSPAIETLCQAIAGFDPQGDDEAGEKIVRELAQLVRLAHELRDAIEEVMVTILVREGRIDSSDRARHADAMTGLGNRLGVEYQLHKWWRDDPERQRLMSAALIDFDRLGKTNEFASTRVADRIIQALAHLLKQQVSRDGGLDRVFRFNGHQFLLFFGDAGDSTAAATVERIRELVAATLFEYQGKQYSLTVRAGVTAMRLEDGTEQLLQRLAELVACAKCDGGNSTCKDNGPQVDVVPPPKQGHPPRTVKIE